MRKWIYAQAGLGLALSCAAAYGVGLQGCGGDDAAAPGKDSGTTQPPTDGGGGGGEGGDGGGFTGPISKNPSRGSAIALSDDESVVAMVNRDSDSISIFTIAYSADGTSADATKVGGVDVKVGGEPWQVVIAPDNDTAYVVLRKDQKLVKVTGIKKAPSVGAAFAQVGSEPTGVALSPTAQKAWVANWVDGTLMGVDTATMKVTSTVDLNAALVKGMPSAYGTIAARPSIAHPRSVAITNNGDANDDDESILVTEFFAQQVTPDTGVNADAAKTGVVYKVKASDKSVSLVKLAPIADMGFKDSAGGAAGCFPNQLQSIAISGKQAYVTSVCASPKGPIGVVTTATPPDPASVKTTTHGAISVLDIDTGSELTNGTASLHAKFDQLYVSKTIADDGTRKYPLIPADVTFVPGQAVGYVAGNGIDAVFRTKFDDKGAFTEAGSSTQLFINLAPAATPPGLQGRTPIGVAAGTKSFMFVANDVSRNLSIVDLKTQALAGTVDAPKVYAAAPLPAAGTPEESVLRGRRFFNTGNARWSLKTQGWGACQSCHIDGYTDNVTWYFARGPRQSVSLDGSFAKGDPTDQRIFNWTAIVDEVADFEGNTRGISGGIGAIVSKTSVPLDVADRIDTAAATLPATGGGTVAGPNQGLSGSSAKLADPQNPLGLASPGTLKDWADITKYIQQIRPPRAATNLDPAKIALGKTAFTDGSCQGCHGGPKWTISKVFYDPTFTNTAALNSRAWTPPAGFPTGLLPAATVANRFMRFAGSPANVAGLDQLQCILRPVGTFNVADPLIGVVEVRQDMSTAAQGNQLDGNGYNPPSLLGLSVGAPYLHAGQVASLEVLFSTTFDKHYTALSPNFLAETDPTKRAEKVSQLVHYLLSLDASATPVAIPAAGASGGNFCSP